MRIKYIIILLITCVCGVNVTASAQTRNKSIFKIQTADLKECGLYVDCDTNTYFQNLHLKNDNGRVLDLILPQRFRNCYYATSYVPYPYDNPIFDEFNKHITELVGHDYVCDNKFMFDFGNMKRASYSGVDSLAKAWDCDVREIMEYESRTYNAYNGHLESSGLAVNPGNSFEFEIDFVDFGQWYKLDSIRVKPEDGYWGDHWTDEYMNTPLLNIDYTNQFTISDLMVSFQIENNIINIQLKNNMLNRSLTAEYDLVNREINRLHYSSDGYISILSFQKGMISRWIVKAMDKDVIESCLKEFEHDEDIIADRVESIVINRRYDSDGFLIKQSFNINRSDYPLLEQFNFKYDPTKEYKIINKIFEP